MVLPLNAAAVHELLEIAPLVGVAVFMASFSPDARPYLVRFQTRCGQWIEAYSCGWHLVNPDYFVGKQVAVYYDEQEPTHFLLVEEVGRLPVFGSVCLLVLGVIGLVIAAVQKVLQ